MSFKWWLLTAVSLFVIGLIFGLVTYNNSPTSLTEETASLNALTDTLMALPRPALLVAIFLKNLLAVLFSIILSPMFLLVPVLTLLLNGWLIGLISMAVVQEKSAGFLLAGLLPHGIFELSALFIGEAVAFSFGTAVILSLLKGQGSNLRLNLRAHLKFLAPVIVLLLIAAAIETYLTPLALGLAI